jgi:lipopolysaccharide biosynthesis regulator YciM
VSVPAADSARGSQFPYIAALCDVLDAIDALHQPLEIQHDSFTRYGCRNCGFTWPCPTARLLHPEDGNT